MAPENPTTELGAEFSEPGATPTAWVEASRRLEEAELYWLSTVRPDGRPHVTPLLSVWQDESAFFCTGATERKAKNLAENAHCILTTGSNGLNEGLDLVAEGDAVRVVDDDVLHRLAEAWEAKYGSDWHFDVQDGAFLAEGNQALVFEVAPVTVFGFAKGEIASASSG